MSAWTWTGIAVGTYALASIIGAVLLGRMIAWGQGGDEQ